jgi:hypothetical protein
MPYTILVRVDDRDQINLINLDQFSEYYDRPPANHLNLTSDGDYHNSGYVSTFRYLENDKSVNADNNSISTVARALNDGELATYKNAHIILIDQQLYDNRTVELNGGKRGLNNESGIIETITMPGTVYTKPKFDKLNLQVFSTKNVDVELGVGKTRYIDEVVLGGNWQKFALCMTLKKLT